MLPLERIKYSLRGVSSIEISLSPAEEKRSNKTHDFGYCQVHTL